LALPQSVISLRKRHDASSRGASGIKFGPADAWFKTTHWSSVLHAADSNDTQDLTQGFLARLVHKDYLNGGKQEKAHFRSFLLVALKRFLANEWDRANRLKRGGGQEVVSFDAQDTEKHFVSEPVEEMSPEKAFERRRALTLLGQVLSRLEAEFCALNKTLLFQELKGVLSGKKRDIPMWNRASGLG
jgi:RNA polymerase sigma-70 factor (ECF subfamily)